MGWETFFLSILGSSVFSTIISFIFNRRKNNIEIKDADTDVEHKVNKYKDDDRINAYEEKQKIQEKFDSLVDKYNELLRKMTDIIEENTKQTEARAKDKKWLIEMEYKFDELQRVYALSRCDRFDCTVRIPPHNVCENESES